MFLGKTRKPLPYFMGKKRTSRYKGVYWCRKDNRWRAQITIYGKKVWVGNYKSEVIAAKAYDNAAREYHGNDAILNFPTKVILLLIRPKEKKPKREKRHKKPNSTRKEKPVNGLDGSLPKK